MIARFPDGSMRFLGEIPLDSSESYLDRTTLTPLAPDEVRQLIEISVDDGETGR